MHSDLKSPRLSWFDEISGPMLIAGPCSVETEDQWIEISRALAATGRVHLMRGGIWKPRTRPGAFEGVGEQGLAWMQRAAVEFGLPYMTEVANADHVESALKAGVSAIWIGARTTVNPFSVQEIAEALQGVRIPVFVKNPVNPDLSLWIGALERFRRVGIEQLAAIHRGFSYFGESIYRNRPMWEIPIALKAQWPDLPIVCDPSHIGGKPELLQAIAQKALDLNMNGLMLETHPNPAVALSDAAQQIRPGEWMQLIGALTVRNESSTHPEFLSELAMLRSRMDRMDEQLMKLLGERFDASAELGEYKKTHDVTILQLERWNEILQTRSEWGRELGMSDEFVQRFLELLHKESIRRQTAVMNPAKPSSGHKKTEN
ncbi:MAG: chorismate mutase [Flavobacteriales bacterium]